jgi:hypothetical protein
MNMPRGKELEQLPMSNIAPGAGEDPMPTDRDIITSKVCGNGPYPGKVDNKKNINRK